MDRDQIEKLVRFRTGVHALSLVESNRVRDDFAKEANVSVRQVPPNRRSVTGLVPSRKNRKMANSSPPSNGIS